MKLSERLSNALLRVAWKSAFRAEHSPAELRRNYSLLISSLPWKLLPSPGKTRIEACELDGVPGLHIVPERPTATVLFYLHGGGYFMGSSAGYQHDLMKFARVFGAHIYCIDYRLAPENPHPAALEDATRAYLELIRRHKPGNIVFGGDSAGGGLVLATLLWLRDQRRPLPARAFCISPWTDLLGTGKSVTTNARRDAWLTKSHEAAWAPWYHGTLDPKTPYISPLYGDPRGLPPLLFLVGDQEILLDDSVRFHEKAIACGVSSELLVAPNMQHVWMYGAPWLEQSKKAVATIARFVKDRPTGP